MWIQPLSCYECKRAVVEVLFRRVESVFIYEVLLRSEWKGKSLFTMEALTTKKLLPLLISISGLCLGIGAAHAQTYIADDWYAVVTSGDATGISNGDTSSASLNYNPASGSTNAAQTYLWSYFADAGSGPTLSDGHQLSLSATITVDYASASSATISGFRFGFYNSSTPHATTESAGENRIGSDADIRYGWTGAYTNTISSGSGLIYRKDEGNASPYASTGSSTSSVLPDGALNQTFTDEVSLNITMTLIRSEDDLSFSGIYGSSTYSGIFEDYFASDYPDTFDTIGFYLGSQGTGATANSLTISDATVTLSEIPEPSSTTLAMGMLGIMGLFYLRGRRVRS